MTGDGPEVSVVVPTRNRWHLLSRTLATALAQEQVVLEVIVVDDGSTDATAPELGRLDDPRVRVVRHQRPLGVARARNAGIAAARGEWLAFLDDDDLWAPTKLMTQLRAVRRAKAVMVYSAAVTVESDGRVLQVLRPPPPAGLREALRPGNMIPAGASNVLARTDVVRGLGGFDPAFDHFADWDLWIRLAAAGPAAACDEVLVAYRFHPGSMLAHNWRPVAEEFARVVRKHDDAPDPEMQRVRMAGLAAWQAWGHRRAGRRARAAAIYLASGLRYRSRGNLARAAGTLLGERALLVAGRVRRGDLRPTAVAAPDWLSRCF